MTRFSENGNKCKLNSICSKEEDKSFAKDNLFELPKSIESQNFSSAKNIRRKYTMKSQMDYYKSQLEYSKNYEEDSKMCPENFNNFISLPRRK